MIESKFQPNEIVVFHDKNSNLDGEEMLILRYHGAGVYKVKVISTGDKAMVLEDALTGRGYAATIETGCAKCNVDDTINSPAYYNRYSVEVVEMARRIWGDEEMNTAAEITAFIYRMRAGTKPDNPVEKDLSKEEWWLNYRNKLNNK